MGMNMKGYCFNQFHVFINPFSFSISSLRDKTQLNLRCLNKIQSLTNFKLNGSLTKLRFVSGAKDYLVRKAFHTVVSAVHESEILYWCRGDQLAL